MRNIWIKSDDSKCNQNYLPIKIRTTRTINSNRTSRHHAGHTNTKTSLPLLAWTNDGNGLKTNIRSLTVLLFIHRKETTAQRIIVGRIISAHHSENTFRNVVNLRFWCLTSKYLFLVRALQINMFTLGVQLYKTMDTVSWGSIYGI